MSVVTLEVLSSQFAIAEKALRDAKSTLDQKSSDFDQKTQTLDEQIKNVGLQIKNIEDQIKAVKADSAKRYFGASSEHAEKKPSDLFLESKSFQEFRKGEGRNASVKIEGGLFSKADLPILSGEGWQRPMQLPGIALQPQNAWNLLNYMTKLQTGERSVSRIVEKGYHALYTKLTASILAGVAAIPVDSVAGLFVGQTLILEKGHVVNEEIVVIDAIDEETKEVTLSAATNNPHSINSSVSSAQFAFTQEANIKPRAHIEFEEQLFPLKTLAVWLPITRQTLQDDAQFSNIVDVRLRESLMNQLVRQIFYGNNGNTELLGIKNVPNVQTYLWSSGESLDSRADAIRGAITLCSLSNYMADLIVLHPSDFRKIETEKGADGHYMHSPMMTGNQVLLWRLPVIESNQLDSGDFFVGCFRLCATVFEHNTNGPDGLTMRVADQHANNFIENAVTVLVEGRFTLVVDHPLGFVYGVFDSAPV
jgi:hypothetical protein